MVERAADADPSAIQDVGVNLRRADVAVTEELLYGTDVRARLQQVGGERVAERMRRRRLRYPRRAHRPLECAL